MGNWMYPARGSLGGHMIFWASAECSLTAAEMQLPIPSSCLELSFLPIQEQLPWSPSDSCCFPPVHTVLIPTLLYVTSMTFGPQQTTTNSSSKLNSQKSQAFQWFQDMAVLHVAHVPLQVLLLGTASAQRFFT